MRRQENGRVTIFVVLLVLVLITVVACGGAYLWYKSAIKPIQSNSEQVEIEIKYEGYYIVTTAEGSYIVGMQPEQFVDLKQRVEENGTARVEGMTKVVIDENVKTIVSAYINHKFIV